MKQLLFATFLACILTLMPPAGARAELALVSPGIDAAGDPAAVELFPPAPWDPQEQELTEEGDFRGAGFPLWYQDTVGLRLTLCLDGEEEAFPCGWEDSPVFTDAGCTEPLYAYQDVVGFGDEAFYFKATSFPFDVPLVNGASAQIALLLETTWSEDTRFNENTGTIGDQDIFIEEEDGTCQSAVGADLHRVEPGSELLFTRIRLRLLDGQAGWYRLTYPYGVKTFYHDGVDRSQVRQQIGDFRVGEPQDYTIALNDPGAFADDPASPFIDVGGSNVTDIDQSLGFSNDAEAGLKSIGPFLVKPDYFVDPALQVPFVEGEGLNQYVGNPIEAEGGHPVVGAPYFDARGRTNNGIGEYANYFKIEFQAGVREIPPAGEWTIVGITDQFNVAGKVAADCAAGVNAPPVVAPEPRPVIGTAMNRAVTFDPFSNDEPGTLPIFKLITAFTGLEEGAEVVFNPNRADVTYVPVADQIYTDVFTYRLRDACGTESAELATLTVMVEDLQLARAQLRVRTGRWLISGSTSHPLINGEENEISLFMGEINFDDLGNPQGTMIGTAVVDGDGNWEFSGKAGASPGGGMVTAVSRLGVASAPLEPGLR